MRAMGKLPELIISSYMNLSLGFVCLILCYSMGGDLSAWNQFDWIDWSLNIGLAFSVLISQTFRFKAYKACEASKLQSWTFLIPIYQFLFDMLIFKAEFTAIQLIGMVIVISVFIFDLVYKWLFTGTKTEEIEETKSDKFK